MRERTCCFTGHRDLPMAGRKELAIKLEKTIISLIERGVQFYGAGGARGFDALAAQTVLDLKNRYPYIKLILVLPCLTQTRGWPAKDVGEYERIKAQADKVVYTSQEYTKGCMFKRNRHLVDNSGICVCYLTKKVVERPTRWTMLKSKGWKLLTLPRSRITSVLTKKPTARISG